MQVFHARGAVEQVFVFEIAEGTAVEPGLLKGSVFVNHYGRSLGGSRAGLYEFGHPVVVEIDQGKTVVFVFVRMPDAVCKSLFP